MKGLIVWSPVWGDRESRPPRTGLGVKQQPLPKAPFGRLGLLTAAPYGAWKDPPGFILAPSTNENPASSLGFDLAQPALTGSRRAPAAR